MIYSLVIKHEAFIDTLEAFNYYEHQQNNLGAVFLAQLDVFYKRIETNPQHFPCKREPYREAFIKKISIYNSL